MKTLLKRYAKPQLISKARICRDISLSNVKYLFISSNYNKSNFIECSGTPQASSF